MSGLFGADSPSASFNLWQSSKGKKKQLPAGVVTQKALPARAAKSVKSPITPRKTRVDYG